MKIIKRNNYTLRIEEEIEIGDIPTLEDLFKKLVEIAKEWVAKGFNTCWIGNTQLVVFRDREAYSFMQKMR